AEEGAALAPALIVGESIGDAVEILVLPVIVARHALNIAKIDHGSAPADRRQMTDFRPLSSVLCPLSSDRGLRFLDDRLEGRRLADRKVGEHLAVDQQPGLAEPVDEAAVGQAERPHRRVQPLDPERAEGALAALAVAIGVLVRLLHRLLGDANRVLAPAVIALGGLEYLLVLGVAGDAALDACHGGSPVV